MPSAKQQPSNVKHGGAVRPNVWVLTFGPPCILYHKYNHNFMNNINITMALVGDVTLTIALSPKISGIKILLVIYKIYLSLL